MWSAWTCNTCTWFILIYHGCLTCFKNILKHLQSYVPIPSRDAFKWEPKKSEKRPEQRERSPALWVLSWQLKNLQQPIDQLVTVRRIILYFRIFCYVLLATGMKSNTNCTWDRIVMAKNLQVLAISGSSGICCKYPIEWQILHNNNKIKKSFLYHAKFTCG